MEMPKWGKWVFGIVVFAAATVGIIWLAGFLFFTFSKTNPIGKTGFSTWWTYWQFYQSDPIIAKRLKVSGIVAAVAGYGIPLVAIVVAMREIRSLHGEARFATNAEVLKSGLLGSSGIIVGKWRNRFLMFPGLQFVLLAAATRTGKGVGIVIPNLLNWRDSVVSLDVKLENFLITSKYRSEQGQKVYLFNPFAITEDSEGNPLNGKTHRYNPLGYISNNPRMRVTDILSIGYALYPGEGREAFFDDAARNLFLGLTLYLCETPTSPCTIGELLRQSSGKGQPVKTYIQGILTARNHREFGELILTTVGEHPAKVIKAIMATLNINEDAAKSLIGKTPISLAENMPSIALSQAEEQLGRAGAAFTAERKMVPITQWDGIGLPPLSMECVDAINRFTSISDNTLSNIMATFNVPLTIWASPIMDAATSTNDFDLREIRKKRMSIYLGIPANKLAEAKLLLNLFYTQLVNLNTNQLLHATPELKYKCLMLNDEFTAPGRIGIIDKSNAYMAGYGLRLLTIIQSPGQLEAAPPKGYGRENARTFVTNHACQILYTPREQRDASEYSEMLGYYTFKAKGQSRQMGSRGGRSESESDQKRALMMPQELKELPLNKQIISLENTKPIKCEKIAYYADHVFVDRLKSISPTLQALGRKLPTQKQLEAVWGSGELAAPVPLLDLDLHEANVQERTRSMTIADIAEGIDLRKLSIDVAKIPLPNGDGLAPEQIEDFVNGFFDALDVSNEYDENTVIDSGASDKPSEEGLPAPDAKACDTIAVEIAKHTIESKENLGHDQGEAADDALAAMTEDDVLDDEFMTHQTEMLDAINGVEDPPFPDELPTLDLSVLDKPLRTKSPKLKVKNTRPRTSTKNIKNVKQHKKTFKR